MYEINSASNTMEIMIPDKMYIITKFMPPQNNAKTLYSKESKKRSLGGGEFYLLNYLKNIKKPIDFIQIKW